MNRSTPPEPLRSGDRVHVHDGTFVGMNGKVTDILGDTGLLRVELTLYGRPVPVELERRQVDPLPPETR